MKDTIEAGTSRNSLEEISDDKLRMMLHHEMKIIEMAEVRYKSIVREMCKRTKAKHVKESEGS